MGFFGPKKIIRRAKIIGVRTGQETKGLTDFNFGIYSFLIEYDDGTIDVQEAKLGTDRMAQLLSYVLYDYC